MFICLGVWWGGFGEVGFSIAAVCGCFLCWFCRRSACVLFIRFGSGLGVFGFVGLLHLVIMGVFCGFGFFGGLVV